MKLILTTLTLTAFLFFISCKKEDNSKEISELRTAVSILQKRSDSLANALSITNTNVSNQLKSIDSIKNQLVLITQQLSSLNAQLNTLSANIQTINAQIADLNAKYADLLAKLNAILNQLNPPVNLTTGLVAFYPFNGNTSDESGNNNNGVINGNVTLSTDRTGATNRAYTFNGGTIVVAHRPYLTINQNNSFTVSFWVNKSGAQNPVHIIGKRGAGAQQFNWQIAQHTTPGGLPGGGLVFTGVVNTTSTGIDYTGVTDPTIAVGKWEHIVGMFENGKWSLYKNGILVAQRINSIIPNDTGSPAMEFGNCGGWGAFIGQIDEIRIYNRSLTLNEIEFLAKN
jgi:hypothetical protein